MRVVAALLLFVSTYAYGEPLYQASQNGAKVVLYSDDCTLKDHITNLPKRAVWTERGETFEGCYGVSPIGVVVAYFSDKTAVAIPVQHFERVVGI